MTSEEFVYFMIGMGIILIVAWFVFGRDKK